MMYRAIWWAASTALGAVTLRIWHLLLLKLALEGPIFAGWIALAWALVGIAAMVERRAPSGAGVPVLWRRLTLETWAAMAVFSALLPLLNIGFMRAAGDGRGYFAQLHSLVFDFDRDFSNDIAAFAARPQDAVYPLGTAVLWAPFYLAAHLWLGLLNLMGAEHLRDGFWNPYQRAVGLGTLVYGLAAVVMMTATLRRTFDRVTSLTAITAILLATPVVWYVAVDASMSHGVSLFAVTLFLASWVTTRGSRTVRQWTVLGAAAALMIAVRPQNGLFLAVLAAEPAVDLVEAWRAGDAPAFRRAMRWAVVLGGSATIVAGAALLLSGTEIGYALRERLFSQWSVDLQLFSAHHGLLSSSPLLVFALLGLVPLALRDRPLAIAFGVVIALQVLVGGTSWGWNAGASFGARRFVACAMPFAFGLAAAIDAARRRPMIPIVALIAGLVAINLALVDEARRGDLGLSDSVPFERMTRAVSDRIGNPFALPGALWFAWRYDLPVAFYDKIPARKYARLQVHVGTAQEDERYLIGSWHEPEVGRGGPFRWAFRPEAGIFTAVRGERYRIRFEAQPFEWPGSPAQVVEVYLGARLVKTVPMVSGMSRYEVEIPEDLMPSDHRMRIAFRFRRVTVPREVMDSSDARPLAVAFRSIGLEPY